MFYRVLYIYIYILTIIRMYLSVLKRVCASTFSFVNTLFVPAMYHQPCFVFFILGNGITYN